MSVERPAALLAAVETETPYGGRTEAWSPVATLWVTLAPGAIDETTASDTPPVEAQSASAVARDHPAAAIGQQLQLPGEPTWLIRELRRATPAAGRMTLILTRLI